MRLFDQQARFRHALACGSIEKLLTWNIVSPNFCRISWFPMLPYMRCRASTLWKGSVIVLSIGTRIEMEEFAYLQLKSLNEQRQFKSAELLVRLIEATRETQTGAEVF